MNKIKIQRLLLTSLATLVVFIVVEFLVETLFERHILQQGITEWYLKLGIQHWNWANNLVNIFIALLNTTMLVWLYAALRPMFGVGVKTALITSLFGLVFSTTFTFNIANLTGGYYPWKIALLESGYLLIELPLAMIAGAYVYERG